MGKSEFKSGNIAKGYVDGLIAESLKVFQGIDDIGTARATPTSRYVDLLDHKWRWKEVIKKQPLSEKIEKCLELDSRGLPPQYRTTVAAFLNSIEGLEPENESWLLPVTRCADAILGNFSEEYREEWKIPGHVLSALQALVDDLYDSFLSKNDRSKIGLEHKQLKLQVPPPLTYICEGPSPFTQARFFFRSSFDFCLVGYPRFLTKGALSVWPALAHETAGHAILDAYPDLLGELRQKIQASLEKSLSEARYHPRDIESICAYWMHRFDEAISDCLGLLFIGPSMAYSLLARLYFEKEKLFSGEAKEDHPSTLLRAHMIACAVGYLDIDREEKTLSGMLLQELEERKRELAEADQDYWPLVTWDIHPEKSQEAARFSAQVFAHTAINVKLACLNDHPLGAIQNWAAFDENLADAIAPLMGRSDFGEYWDDSLETRKKAYPAHLLAAAIKALPGKPAGGMETVFKNLLYAINTSIENRLPGNDYLDELNREFDGEKPGVKRFQEISGQAGAEPAGSLPKREKKPRAIGDKHAH